MFLFNTQKGVTRTSYQILLCAVHLPPGLHHRRLPNYRFTIRVHTWTQTTHSCTRVQFTTIGAHCQSEADTQGGTVNANAYHKGRSKLALLRLVCNLDRFKKSTVKILTIAPSAI